MVEPQFFNSLHTRSHLSKPVKYYMHIPHEAAINGLRVCPFISTSNEARPHLLIDFIVLGRREGAALVHESYSLDIRAARDLTEQGCISHPALESLPRTALVILEATALTNSDMFGVPASCTHTIKLQCTLPCTRSTRIPRILSAENPGMSPHQELIKSQRWLGHML